jgi:DNA-binding NarL/FixJ family response regulator
MPVVDETGVAPRVWRAVFKQVIDETLRGLTNQEIALKLELGVSTIKHYKSLAFKKMGVRNRMEARVAIRNMAKFNPL